MQQTAPTTTAPDDALAEPRTWPAALTEEIGVALLAVADAAEDVMDAGLGATGAEAEAFDDAYDLLLRLLGTTHGELRCNYDPILRLDEVEPRAQQAA